MKQTCNEIMKVSPNIDVGTDYSGIALLWFWLENMEHKETNFSILSFSEYLYRFYADNEYARQTHYHKLINNIFNYCPSDFVEYSKNCLSYWSKYFSFLFVGYDTFCIRCNISEDKWDTARSVFKNLIKAITKKYLHNTLEEYESSVSESEFAGRDSFVYGSRVFNRTIERRNYCFVCEENDLSDLMVVPIKKDSVFDANNYILLCKNHACMYMERKLQIRKNGYPYINGKRMLNHIAIDELKLIRDKLEPV